MTTLTTQNPHTETVIQHYPCLDQIAIDHHLNQANQCFNHWRHLSYEARGQCMMAVANQLQSNKTQLAQTITLEMGMPIQSALSEIDKCTRQCQYYANKAEQLLEPKVIDTQHTYSAIHYLPLGCLLGIMPWNFPFWQVFRFAIPNLMAGNTLIIKHAPITTGCGQAIDQCFQAAGAPDGLIKHLIIDETQAGTLIADRRIKGVSLTGSTKAGRAVASLAAKHLKPQVLELGGSDPFIILDDANLEQAARHAVTARLINSGQCCIAAKRIIATTKTMPVIQAAILQKTSTIQVGNPSETNTQIGPLARADLRALVHDQVQESIELGAQCLTGGIIPEGPGFHYPITVLCKVQPNMPVFKEECFGPVFALIEAQDEEHALALANESQYGLGAVIMSQNIQRAQELATYHLHAGSCFINSPVATQPELSVGGIADSGYGRELADAGIKAFVNAKTVCVNK